MFYHMNEISSHFSYVGSQGRAKMMKKYIDVEQTLKRYLECCHLQDPTAMAFLNKKEKSKRR